ncbi:hypothetical protein D3C86_1977480 [compost metagenome]
MLFNGGQEFLGIEARHHQQEAARAQGRQGVHVRRRVVGGPDQRVAHARLQVMDLSRVRLRDR